MVQYVGDDGKLHPARLGVAVEQLLFKYNVSFATDILDQYVDTFEGQTRSAIQEVIDDDDGITKDKKKEKY